MAEEDVSASVTVPVEGGAIEAAPVADGTVEAVPTPENKQTDKKEPLKFRDAVGRKFKFPFEMASTWKGVHELIVSAFLHIDVLGVHVNEGHYDLVGPGGEIILPIIWEAIIEPGWSISMLMWPMPEARPGPPPPPPPGGRPGLGAGPVSGIRPPLPPGPPGLSTKMMPGSRLTTRRHRPGRRPPPAFEAFKLITISESRVINFPECATFEGDFSLHLVLLPFKFTEPVDAKNILVRCKLTPPFEEGPTDEMIDFVKMGFFQPNRDDAGFEQIKDTHDLLEISCQVEMYFSNEFCFAILVQRRRSESTVEFAADFEVRDIESEEVLEQDHIQVTAKVDSEYRNGPTPFLWAMTNQWETALDLLLQQPEVLQNQQDFEKQSALSWAARLGYRRGLEILLVQNSELADQRDSSERTPLSWAAGQGYFEIVELLLTRAHVIDPGAPDSKGRGPISHAAEKGHANIVEYLLKQGKVIDADYPDSDEKTPLWWAVEQANHEIVKILLDLGRGIEEGGCLVIQNDEEICPMSIAADMEDQKSLCLLIEEHIRQSTTAAYKPLSRLESWKLETFYLHFAAKYGWVDVVKLLLEKPSVTVDMLDPEHERTPLCMAAEGGKLEAVIALLKAKADHNFVTRTTRDTPLGFAIRSGEKDVVKALIDAGVEHVIGLMNAKGETPRALAQRHPEIFSMIASVDVGGKLSDQKELRPLVDHEFTATIVEIGIDGGIQGLEVTEVRVDELLAKPRYPFKGTWDPDDLPSLRWLHLPANNMLWIECLITKLYNDDLALAYNVLESERWMKRQHHGAGHVHHARFMRAHCQSFPSSKSFSFDKYNNNLVLFMPFLHWDVDAWRTARQKVAQESSKPDDASWDSEKRLMNSYLANSHPPLHLRRTLDQYYYHTLSNTDKRDKDQVVTRYQTNNRLQPGVITMVDQLWLWVLEGVDEQPDTIISCFPEVGNADPAKAGVVRDLDPESRTNVLGRVKHHLLAEPYSIETAYDLAGLIATTCSRTYLDPGSTLTVANSRDKWGLQFSELYQTEISDIAEEEANRFEEFTLFKENQVANIKTEINLLSRIKDILDELNIMDMLFDDQRKVLRLMDDIVRSTSTFKPRDTPASSRIPTRSSSPSDVVRAIDRSDAGTVKSGSTERTISEAGTPVNRTARPIWGSRDDHADFSMPLAMVKVNSGEVRAMIERAEKAKAALTFLVDLKQKQNDVIDSKTSLEQGRIVLIFTITTIIFLPVSFMTSFFTLNIREFQRNEEGNLGLGYVSYIIFPISTFISATLIWIAFNYSALPDAWQRSRNIATKMWAPRRRETDLHV